MWNCATTIKPFHRGYPSKFLVIQEDVIFDQFYCLATENTGNLHSIDQVTEPLSKNLSNIHFSNIIKCEIKAFWTKTHRFLFSYGFSSVTNMLQEPYHLRRFDNYFSITQSAVTSQYRPSNIRCYQFNSLMCFTRTPLNKPFPPSFGFRYTSVWCIIGANKTGPLPAPKYNFSSFHVRMSLSLAEINTKFFLVSRHKGPYLAIVGNLLMLQY